MPTVNIAVGSVDLAWIGGRLARELAFHLKRLNYKATVNSTRPTDLHFEQIVYGPPKARPAVGFFTHGTTRPKQFAKDYDGFIVTNPVMQDHLLEAGAPITRIAVIPLPVDTVTFKLSRPLRFGVAGRTYSDGRKGEAMVAAMVAAGYNVVAWGSGWPCPIVGADLSQLPEFYRSLDYYIDTSTDEGGCVPALEAIACGVPVISHDCGVQHPAIKYRCGDWDDLKRVLESITRPRGYADWARDHAALFNKVLGR